MLDNLIPNDAMVTVAVAQTTFAVLTTPKAHFRVDFIDKAEAYLKPGMRGNFKSYSEHPLLLGYNGGFLEVYINSRPQEPERLFNAIRERLESAFQGWRDWDWIISGGENQLRKNILDGSGLILRGRLASVAQAVIETCAEQEAATYVCGDITTKFPDTPAFQIFLVGKGYVISKDFRVVELSKEKPRLSGQ